VWIGVIAAVVVVAVAVLMAINITGGDSKAAESNLAGVDDATALFADTKQSGLEIGKADAPVTIVEYLDIQCPHCKDAATSTVPTLISQFVNTGQAKILLQPIAFIGDDSTKGALAVIAAGKQNRAGEFAEILFRNQAAEESGWVTDGILNGIASAINLDGGKFSDARSSDAAKSELSTIAKTAGVDQVQSTPTFIVKGPKGQVVIQNRQNVAEFAQAIAKVK
jgi:protein-disulfide isomerase